MTHAIDVSRRKLVRAGGLVLGSALCAPAILTRPTLAGERKRAIGKPKQAATGKDSKEEVSPPEDLMREHGVLDRVLLVYEATLQRFSANEDVDPALVTRSAEIIRDFINNYHEKSEEKYVFPRFKLARKLTGLVDVLLVQHEAGRRVTTAILRLAPESRSGSDSRRELAQAMQSFIAMYRPHAAREDTELFPKLKDVVSSNEYDAMAEAFEKEEHRLFGDDGFEKMVQRVAALERSAGINDLSQFTARSDGTDGRSLAR
jgi:hemerythrin-like domain-containing protein